MKVTYSDSGFVVWLTGLPGSGKSTIARLLKSKLEHTFKVEILDGNEIRSTLYPELGFSKEERRMNNRIVAHIAKLLVRNGVVVIVSLVSPYAESRKMARDIVQENFVEIWVKCPIEICKARDPKGEYRMALDNKIANFTGIQGAYEPPENPELVVDTSLNDSHQSCSLILDFLKSQDLIG